MHKLCYLRPSLCMIYMLLKRQRPQLQSGDVTLVRGLKWSYNAKITCFN